MDSRGTPSSTALSVLQTDPADELGRSVISAWESACFTTNQNRTCFSGPVLHLPHPYVPESRFLYPFLPFHMLPHPRSLYHVTKGSQKEGKIRELLFFKVNSLFKQYLMKNLFIHRSLTGFSLTHNKTIKLSHYHFLLILSPHSSLAKGTMAPQVGSFPDPKKQGRGWGLTQFFQF